MIAVELTSTRLNRIWWVVESGYPIATLPQHPETVLGLEGVPLLRGADDAMLLRVLDVATVFPGSRVIGG